MKTFGEYLTEAFLPVEVDDFSYDRFIHNARSMFLRVKDMEGGKVLHNLTYSKRPIKAEFGINFRKLNTTKANERLEFVKHSLRFIELIGIPKTTKPITNVDEGDSISLVFYTKYDTGYVNVECMYNKKNKSAFYYVTLFAK